MDVICTEVLLYITQVNLINGGHRLCVVNELSILVFNRKIDNGGRPSWVR